MNALLPGLCSVTLRSSSVDDVARVAGECGLAAIEWAADVHVPPGDRAAAHRARAASEAAGLVVASYGSYLFASGPPEPGDDVRTLDTAVALGAGNVRVWAGFGIEPGTAEYAATVEGLRAVSRLAAERNLTVSLEYHGWTPTETVAGAQALINEVGAPNLFTYWQPPYWRAPTAPAADAAEVVALGGRLSHLHVYEWSGPEQRESLAGGEARWCAVLDVVGHLAAWSEPRCAFLEFVADDDPAALARDAAVLRRWLAA